jgi:hypothetical protein
MALNNIYVKFIQDFRRKIKNHEEEEEESIHKQTGLEFREETSKVPHLEPSFLRC